MKNIHLLPTSHSSRLYLHSDSELQLRTNIIRTSEDYFGSNQHIYITSDDEIKDGDWCFHSNQKSLIQIGKNEGKLMRGHIYLKKIILTTDQSLDSIQSIDDDFLEWFVKNPSCQYGGYKDIPWDKIITQKEEPKQETTSLEEAAERLFHEEKYPTEFKTLRKAFISNAKWQAERMYSEEEMLQALNIGFTSTDETWEECVEFAKEQFKKK